MYIEHDLVCVSRIISRTISKIHQSRLRAVADIIEIFFTNVLLIVKFFAIKILVLLIFRCVCNRFLQIEQFDN